MSVFPIFSMLNDFESKSFHTPEIKAQHRSVYYFLIGVLMQRRGAKRFELAYDYGMMGSKIGNHGTYTNVLKDLEGHGFLKYTPGKNRFTTPIIDMQFCEPTANLLATYRESIGVSTANINKDTDTVDAEDTVDAKRGRKPAKKEIELPFKSEAFTVAWQEWKEYKKQEHGKGYKTELGESRALKRLVELANGFEANAIKIIDQSMANGWEGLFELKGGTIQQAPQPKKMIM